MRTDSKHLDLLIREGESLFVEFKESYTARIDEDIVAFSNTKGGVILLGVKDNGMVSPIELTNDLKARVNSVARNCEPTVDLDLKQAGDLIVVDVPEGDEKPYSCKAGYFRRLNGATQKMSRNEIRIMFSENDPFPYEERFVKGFTDDDISHDNVVAFTREAGIDIGKNSPLDILTA